MEPKEQCEISYLLMSFLVIPLPAIIVWNVLMMNKMQPSSSTSLMSNQLINKRILQKESIKAKKYLCNCNKSELIHFRHNSIRKTSVK
ncbi:hypothetical protein T10_2592 [Trichinella papuae]|uniref:Uncharacterized protein n=1 Tax=Trichinella papuae TaxID=268474 RepID=A0A0V1M2G1_9BILA|nr:hypothetical protein T10_2592 [Trichinella papuae]